MFKSSNFTTSHLPATIRLRNGQLVTSLRNAAGLEGTLGRQASVPVVEAAAILHSFGWVVDLGSAAIALPIVMSHESDQNDRRSLSGMDLVGPLPTAYTKKAPSYTVPKELLDTTTNLPRMPANTDSLGLVVFDADFVQRGVPLVHYLMTGTGKEVVEWIPPGPPQGATHVYIVVLCAYASADYPDWVGTDGRNAFTKIDKWVPLACNSFRYFQA